MQFAMLAVAALFAQEPQVQELLGEVSQTRIANSMKKLESFGSRNTHYEKGNKAAREWIASELKSYSPRLAVGFDSHKVEKQGRILRDLEVHNVVATLTGSGEDAEEIILCAHYDSLNIIERDGRPDWEATADSPVAPGVSDNASGVALMLEVARLMSQKQWPRTLVFVAFSGEEQGLFGSKAYVKTAQAARRRILGVLNSDIVGNDFDGNGRRVSDVVDVYSGDPDESPSRQLAELVKEVAGRYGLAMEANLILRGDRPGRAGDQMPFHEAGYPAVRFTTPVEHHGFQHTAQDTFEHASPAYATEVTRLNLAVAGSLALGPAGPR